MDSVDYYTGQEEIKSVPRKAVAFLGSVLAALGPLLAPLWAVLVRPGDPREAREAPGKCSGRLFLASGGALARQEQAEGPKGQKKEAKSNPRPAQERQEAILDDFDLQQWVREERVGGESPARKSLMLRL